MDEAPIVGGARRAGSNILESLPAFHGFSDFNSIRC